MIAHPDRSRHLLAEAVEIPDPADREAYSTGLRRRPALARAGRAAGRRPLPGRQLPRTRVLPRPGPHRSPHGLRPTASLRTRSIGPYKLLEQIGEGGHGRRLSWPSRPSRSAGGWP